VCGRFTATATFDLRSEWFSIMVEETTNEKCEARLSFALYDLDTSRFRV
jgi:hypothetical protein